MQKLPKRKNIKENDVIDNAIVKATTDWGILGYKRDRCTFTRVRFKSW